MKYIILLISLWALVGCGSFQTNSQNVVRACKNGVKNYDDGTVSFACFSKENKASD